MRPHVELRIEIQPTWHDMQGEYSVLPIFFFFFSQVWRCKIKIHLSAKRTNFNFKHPVALFHPSLTQQIMHSNGFINVFLASTVCIIVGPCPGSDQRCVTRVLPWLKSSIMFIWLYTKFKIMSIKSSITILNYLHVFETCAFFFKLK